MSTKSSYNPLEHWADINIDFDALQKIVCDVFRISPSQCGPPVAIGSRPNYARVFSFQLPTRKIIARLVYPVTPVFKTEGEVAAMDFVRSHTSLPVPKVFAYCSEPSNPVGVEWLIMEYMPGVEMSTAWDTLGFPQKQRLALDLIDLYDQMSRLKADGCGSIYHRMEWVDNHTLLPTKNGDTSRARHQRSPRWTPLSLESLSQLKTLCNHPVDDEYSLGPLNDVHLFNFYQKVPPPAGILPVFSSEEYVNLIALNGFPTTRCKYDVPTREKCVELFQSIFKLYPNSKVFGPPSDSLNFYFSHGDLHDENIFIDPQSGAITGIIDWETAAFRPLWTTSSGVGWFDEDNERFRFGSWEPNNFADDTEPRDAELRAFFRTEMNKRNPDLFAAFLGAIELRAVLHAAGDVPRPMGESDIFLSSYHWHAGWNEHRRGPFPWDMIAWMHRRIDLDEQQTAEEGPGPVSLHVKQCAATQDPSISAFQILESGL